MDKNKTVLRLFSAIAVILIGFGTMAYAADGTTGQGIHEQSLAVKNWKGEHLGTSHHVILNPSTGDIVFIIVALGQEEDKEIAVPASLFSIDKENGILVLNVNKKVLDSSPAYHDSDLQDPEFIKKVYRFFGIAPSWTEEKPPEGKNESPMKF